MGTTCKPITEAEILDLINNEEKVIKSLEHLGIYKDDGKLNAVLEYYEVFTKEEFIRFQNYVKKHLIQRVTQFNLQRSMLYYLKVIFI